MSVLFRDRVTIQRPTAGYSSTREPTLTWNDVATGVPGSIQPRSGSYRQREFGRPDGANFAGFVGPGVDVKVGDRVVRAAETYLVQFAAVQPDHIELDLQRVVDAG